MTEHRKCKNCKGSGKVLHFYTKWNGQPKAEEIDCPECGGKGFVEKTKSGSDIVVHPK
jgi:hypothetical protein